MALSSDCVSAEGLTHGVVGRTQFLAGCWAEDLNSSLADGQRSPSGLCYLGLSLRESKLENEREQ